MKFKRHVHTLCMLRFCMTPWFKLQWHLIIMRRGISTLAGDELWHKAPVSSVTSISNVREEQLEAFLNSQTEELTKPLIATIPSPFFKLRGTKEWTCDHVFDLGLKFILQRSINHIFREKKKKIERINPFLCQGEKKHFRWTACP